MELLRVLRKSVVFIAIFLGIIIWLSIFKINNTNDKKVYAYYNQLMYEYANQTEMIGSLTYSRYAHDKGDDYEADREYIEEAIKLLQESFNRFLIISLDVLICRYSPLFRAFPALFISEEPHKSFYYPSCFRSQK